MPALRLKSSNGSYVVVVARHRCPSQACDALPSRRTLTLMSGATDTDSRGQTIGASDGRWTDQSQSRTADPAGRGRRRRWSPTAYNHVWRGGKIAGTGRWFAEPRDEAGDAARVARERHRARRRRRCSIVGLFTPLAAGACAGVMLVALITNHRKNGFFIFRPGEGWEYVGNLAVACFAIACLGAGRMVARQRRSTSTSTAGGA